MMSVLDDFMDGIYEKTVAIPERINKSINEHFEIYGSIKAGQAEDAKRLMTNHLMVVESEIEGYIKKENTQ
jgi:DNA-binding GntR family transcriptional regulator